MGNDRGQISLGNTVIVFCTIKKALYAVIEEQYTYEMKDLALPIVGQGTAVPAPNAQNLTRVPGSAFSERPKPVLTSPLFIVVQLKQSCDIDGLALAGMAMVIQRLLYRNPGPRNLLARTFRPSNLKYTSS